MLILAMAPPVPIGGNIFVALLMLGLVGKLVSTIRGRPSTGRSIGLAVMVLVGVVVVLEVFLPRSYGAGFHDRGVLASVAGAISGCVLLRPARSGNKTVKSACLKLAGFAFISGPLVTLLLASLMVLFTDVFPSDRRQTFAVFTAIGLLAGLIGAAIVAIASASGSFDSSKSDSQG